MNSNDLNGIVRLQQVEDSIITIRGEKVILDSKVAELYGVETREVNQAVRNNPEKFPLGYILELNNKDLADLRSKNLTANISPKSRAIPKAFTEKGLYMLATILKSTRATQTTIAIVETFAKIRELSRTVAELAEVPEEFKQKSLMQRSGEILADILDDDMKTSDTETTIELNFAVLKFKHTVKRKNKENQR